VPFTDKARIHVEGGHGGHGGLSFRREARVPKGGPDGGNGGRGGDVVIVADPQVVDLSRFRHAVHHKAAGGANGEGRVRHGRSGADANIHVPPGTRIVRDEAVIAELRAAGDRVVVARGGNGGIGNRVFRSSTHRAPRETVPGTPGEATWLTLELRLPIEVAIVGLPNSGKSALLVALTGAGAVVAPYPHSTREPAFGPLVDDGLEIHLVADLPGVGADGQPRPDGFLTQCERARVILHCVDAAIEDPPAPQRIAAVNTGLGAFISPEARRIVVATSADPERVPVWAERAVDSESGAGIPALRQAVLDALGVGRQ
jgi:GTP-binding protein